MTSPVAHVGLFYDAVDLQQPDLQWFFEIERGLDETPSVRGKDSIVPAANGRTERNRKNDVLSIVLLGHVRADPSSVNVAAADASYRENLTFIRNLFRSSRPRATLVAVLEDGTIKQISARPMNIVPGRTVPPRFRSLSIELEGYDDWEEATGS